MKYFICFTLRANISASDYFRKWVSEDQLEIRSLITASVRSIFRTDMQYYNQRWNVCRNYNKYKSWWYVAKLEYIFKYFHAFSKFYESVRRGDLKNKEKPFPSRTSLNFKIRVHWTLGDPKGGSAPLPSPVPKKRGGVREGSLSRNWPLCEWNIYDRRTHSAFKIRSSTSLKMKLEYHDHFNNSWPYKIPYQERILSSLDDVLSFACSNLPLTKMARKMETLRNGEKYHLGKKVVTCQES